MHLFANPPPALSVVTNSRAAIVAKSLQFTFSQNSSAYYYTSAHLPQTAQRISSYLLLQHCQHSAHPMPTGFSLASLFAGSSLVLSRDPGSICATRNGRTFSCKVCGYRSDKWAHMVQHARKHTGERPFTCHLCPARFFQRHDMMRHVRSHTSEKPFQCDTCGKLFSRRDVRNRHERTHFEAEQNPQ